MRGTRVPEDDAGEQVGPELLDVSSQTATVQTSTVDRNAAGSRLWAIVAAATAVVLGGLLVLDSVGPRGDGDEPLPEESARPTSTSAAPPQRFPSSSTIVEEDTSTTEVDDSPTEIGPLFDQPTGLSLLIGGEQPLVRIDLDSGEIHELGVRAVPLLVTEDYLVVQSMTGSLRAVSLEAVLSATGDTSDTPLDNPPLGPPGGGGPLGRGSQPNTLWIQSWQTSGEVVELWSIETNEVIRTLDASRIDFDFAYGPFGTSTGRTDVVNGRAGGVYRIVDDGFRRLFDGRLIARGERVAVIEECDERLRCETFYVDLDTEQRLDSRPPAELPGVGFGAVSLVGNDRYLVSFDYADGTSTVFDVASGASIGLPDSGTPELRAFSPDGRFVASVGPSLSTIVDLDTNETATVDLRGVQRFGWTPALFVRSLGAPETG